MLMVNPLVGFGAGGKDALTITQVASSTSTGGNITAPAGILAGDLLVILDRAWDIRFTPPASVTPSGFTLIGSSLSGTNFNDGFNYKQNVSYKLANGSEASASIAGMSGGGGTLKAMLVFRGNTPATALTLGGSAGQITDNDPTLQTCAASGGVAPLVVFGCYGSSGVVNPRTFSTTKDGEVNPSTSLYLAWKIYNSAPVDSNIDMDDEGNMNGLQSFYIQMA
jgi:hypothetical protein